jgi:hypothetical protein
MTAYRACSVGRSRSTGTISNRPMRLVRDMRLLALIAGLSTGCTSGHRWSVAVTPVTSPPGETISSHLFEGAGPATPRQLHAGQDVGVFVEEGPTFPHDTLAVVVFTYQAQAQWTCGSMTAKDPTNPQRGTRCSQMGWTNWCDQRCIMDKLRGATRMADADAFIMPRGLFWQTPPPGSLPSEVRFTSYVIRCPIRRCGH